MRALWLENGCLALLEDLPEPVASTDEVTIEVRCAGICGTDMAMIDGYADMVGIPGHEFVGVVVEGNDEWQGRRVVAEINVACGNCEMCKRGHANHCELRSVIGIRESDGAFAERLSVPVSNLHRVPDNVTDEAAVLVEPLAAAFEIPEQIDIDPSDQVLIIGAGRLAQLIAQVILRSTERVDIIARSSARTVQFSPLCVNISDHAEGSYDIVIECSGNPAGLALAIDHVRPRGMLVLKSTYNDEVALDFNRLVVDEITVVGSRCGPFERAIDALANNEIDLSSLPFEHYRLDEFKRAFERARAPEVYKVLFDLRD
jgi:threonine dehydrogenase-like Zn-dependent dehydrogenase